MIAAHLEGVEQNPRPYGPVEATLTENYHAFLRFLVRRLGDASAAEDVLQSFCLRAVSRGTEVRHSERVLAWLYSVLRSVLADHYRSEAARQRRDASYAQEQLVLGNDREDIEMDGGVCNCFRDSISALRPAHAEVLQRVDLSGERSETVAADLGITPVNLRVRRHRARQALRKTLGNRCEYGFHDCTGICASSRDGLAPHYRRGERPSFGEKPSVVDRQRGTSRPFDSLAYLSAKAGWRGDAPSLQ